MTNLPPGYFRDLKTQDSSTDKVLRMTGLILWALILLGLLLSAFPVGAALTVVSIFIRLWLQRRRAERYARNAEKLAYLHSTRREGTL